MFARIVLAILLSLLLTVCSQIETPDKSQPTEPATGQLLEEPPISGQPATQPPSGDQAEDQVEGVTAIAQCQRIDSSGHYALTSDLSGAPVELTAAADLAPPYTGQRTLDRACIEIAASQVTLDCQNHNMDGSGDPSSGTAGIVIAGSGERPLSDVTVENCAITGHQFGLYTGHLDGGRIRTNQVRRNAGTGIYLISSTAVTITGNAVEGNDPDGILVLGSQDVTVVENAVFYNRMRGITFDGCQACLVRNNESYGHGVLGFAIYASTEMVLEQNVAHDNRYHGFAILHGAGSAAFRGNESYQNGSTGIYAESSQSNQYVGNISRENALDGLALFGDSRPAVFEGNSLVDNGHYGLFSDGLDVGQLTPGNIFSGNELGDATSSSREEIDSCIYTGFGPDGPCDPVFEGGPNLNDPLAQSPTGTAAPAAAGTVVAGARIVGEPVYYPAFGDLWMSTWAADDRLFFTWGDGTGWGDGYPTGFPAHTGDQPITVTACQDEYFPCGLWCAIFTCETGLDYPPAVLTDAGVLVAAGWLPELEELAIAAIDVPSGEPFFLASPDGSLDVAGNNDKPSSILYQGGRLYFAGHYPAGGPIMGYLAYSDDDGRTWSQVPGSPWGENSNFRVLMFVNMGQGYGLNQDGYVYALGVGTEASWTETTVYLARVPLKAILDYQAYEYFSGMDGDHARWSPDESQAVPLEDLHSTGQASAVYHEGTGRYLFLTTHSGDPDALPNTGALYTATEPWGPWRLAAELCFLPECNDGNYDPVWTDGKYIAGLIAKDAGPNHVYFTIAGGDDHYQLQIGRLELVTNP